MRVMELRDGWGAEHIVPGERPDPVPGPRDLLLRMKAASLNYRDTLIVNQGYGPRGGALPMIPISDGVGEVVAVGDEVRKFQVGDRVCPTFFPNWIDGDAAPQHFVGALGGQLDGVMQEEMRVPEDAVVAVPAHLTDLEAATLPCAGLTAWSAVVAHAGVQPGDVVLVQGSGGVALFALQFAKLAGATVIATSSTDEKLARLQALGADHVINYRQDKEWGRSARKLTGGRGVDLVVEVGGAETLAQSIRATRVGGMVALIGVLGGSGSQVNLGLVVTQNMRLQGVTVGNRTMFEARPRAIAASGLQPVLDEKTWAFDELRSALEAMPRAQHFGKICLKF